VARNAFALALLTALALGGCSTIKGALSKGDKPDKAAEAKLVALRARTDSLRKARRVADSLAQIQFTACSDSVRLAMSTPPVAAKPAKTARKKKKKQPAFVQPSEELISSQTQTACGQGSTAPQPSLASNAGAKGASAADSTKQPAQPTTKTEASAKTDAPVTAMPAAAPAAAAAAPGATLATAPAAQADSSAAQAQDPAYADSVQKAKEMEMTRETFAYSGAARDPFSSLLNMAKDGPELADLQLVGIYQNLQTPSASVAVFREKDGGKRHKLRAGDQLGRSRLVQIRDRDVVFTIEDFGFERQETLSLRKQEDLTP
jgi:hypothetical protein